jgi:hypothetical protein
MDGALVDVESHKHVNINIYFPFMFFSCCSYVNTLLFGKAYLSWD